MAENQANQTAEQPAPAPTIRAKFQCSGVMDTTPEGAEERRRVHMTPVIGDNVDGSENENNSFSKNTPWGVLELAITNPKAFDFFQAGKHYYLDITHAD